MDLAQRLWPRRAGSSDLNLSLAERLRELCEETPRVSVATDEGNPGNQDQIAHSPGAEKPAQRSCVAAADSPAVAPPVDEAPATASEEKGETKQAAVAPAVRAGDQAADGGPNHWEIQREEQPQFAAAEPQAAVPVEIDSPEQTISDSQAEEAKDVSDDAGGVAVDSSVTRQQQDERGVQAFELRNEEKPETSGRAEELRQEDSSSVPASMGPGQQFLERIHGAVDRAKVTGKETAAHAGQMPPEFQSVQRQFEADLRVRVEGALAEFERRMASQALVEDIAEPFEKKIRQAADSIFSEVQGQAWMMHNAVAGELRAFRDQFAKEIQDRIALLDRSAQQALQLKEKLEEALPRAEEALRSLQASGQETAAKFQTASNVFDDHLRHSREGLSREIHAHRETLEALARDHRQEGQHLMEEMEKFRSEAGAAYDLLAQTTDRSLERLNAGADEVHARTRNGLDKLAAETERSILSGGIIEKANEQLTKATELLLTPALDRVHSATRDADSAAESLSRAGQRISGQLDTARQEIDSRLENLLGEQLNLLETTMSGFQEKATAELGTLVERVVAQSTEQLDQRLHGLLQDLFVTTNRQVNDAARTTLSTLHHGLKEVFDQATADNGAGSNEPAAGQ